MAHKNRHRLVGAEVTYFFWALPCRLGHLLLVSPRQGVTHRETGESFYNAVPCGCTQQARLDYAEIALLRTGVCVCARAFFFLQCGRCSCCLSLLFAAMRPWNHSFRFRVSLVTFVTRFCTKLYSCCAANFIPSPNLCLVGLVTFPALILESGTIRLLQPHHMLSRLCFVSLAAEPFQLETEVHAPSTTTRHGRSSSSWRVRVRGSFLRATSMGGDMQLGEFFVSLLLKAHRTYPLP